MRSNQYDSVLCPLALRMSQTISKDRETRGANTHTHVRSRVRNTLQRDTASIIVFLCLGICSDNMRSSHFIPHVKRHYSCCFTLIDSSFFHFISIQRVQGLQDFLNLKRKKEIKMNTCINNTALCEAFMNWKIKSKVSERKDELFGPAAFHPVKLVSLYMKEGSKNELL